MDVLLINSNVARCALSGYGPTPAPAGLISLAGVLRHSGYRVRICQAHSHVLAQDEDGLPLLRRELEPLLAAGVPDAIGVSVRNVGAMRRPANPFQLLQYYSVFYDARLVRALRMVCGAPVIIGGTAFTVEPGLYMKHVRPDYGLLGEAEETLPALLDCLAAGCEPEGIPGLARTPEDVAPGRRTYGRVADMSVLGPGAFEAVDDFHRSYYEQGGLAPVQTKRGCPMQCLYCTTPCIEGAAYRFRPMEHVIAEMRAYRDACSVCHFFIVDATFNHPLDHALEVCDAFIRADLGVRWFTELTPAAVTDELCRQMVRAGCIGVTLTPDTCAEATLRSYGKPFGVAEVRNAIRLLKAHGIPFDTCLIVGGPGETEGTLAESMAFCEEHLSGDVVRFCDGMVLTESSRGYRVAVDEGLIDPSRPYEELVLRNDFRAAKAYHYFFPHVRDGRAELMARLDRECRRSRWLLTSRDYAPDSVTGEIALSRSIHLEPGARPWWKGMHRAVPALSED